MTSTIERDVRTPKAALPGANLPQVNLLPLEIRASRAVGRLKRALAAGLVAVLLLAVAGYGAAALQARSSRDQLSSAQADGARLAKDQKKYAEVPVVLGKLSALRSARAQGFSTEIDWKPYLGAILAVLPAGVTISSIDVAGATPMLATVPNTDPLQGPNVARIAFSGRSATLPDTGAWIDALDSVPGFAYAWVASGAAAEDPTSGVFYTVSATVQVTDVAYLKRFALGKGN